MTEAFPLTWPAGWPRTQGHSRDRARFAQKASGYGEYTRLTSVTFDKAARELYEELERLGAKSVTLSSNLAMRADGIPYAKQSRIEDPGVAVYFKREGKDQCIPCDKWDRAEDNIKAIVKTIEALRGIERWGAKNMVDAAFRGFLALPAPMDYAFESKSVDDLKEMLRDFHPDTGNSPNTDKFQAVLGELRKRRA